MNVRQATETTLSLTLAGLLFSFLVLLIRQALPYEVYAILDQRFDPQGLIDGYHQGLLVLSFLLLVLAGVIDAIQTNRKALDLIHSLNIPLVLGGTMILLAFIPPLNIHRFWGLFYLLTLICLYRAFRKTTAHSYPAGQGLISFIKGVRKEMASKAAFAKGHVSDRWTLFGLALVLVGIGVLVLVSCGVFVIEHWGGLTG